MTEHSDATQQVRLGLTAAQRRAYKRLPRWLAEEWLEHGARLTDLDRLRDKEFAHWLVEHEPVALQHSLAHTLHLLYEEFKHARAEARFLERTRQLNDAERGEVAAILARLDERYLFVPDFLYEDDPVDPEVRRLRSRWWLIYRSFRDLERGIQPLWPDALREIEAELQRLEQEIDQRVRADQAPVIANGQSEEAFVQLYLRADAPYAVAYAAYRALARLHHPDLGGDPAEMQAINAAWEIVRASYPRSAEPT